MHCEVRVARFGSDGPTPAAHAWTGRTFERAGEEEALRSMAAWSFAVADLPELLPRPREALPTAAYDADDADAYDGAGV